MRELELKEKKIKEIQSTGDRLLREDHPARPTVEVRGACRDLLQAPLGGGAGLGTHLVSPGGGGAGGPLVGVGAGAPRATRRAGPDGPCAVWQSFQAALQTQWSWMLQLCCCIEAHLKENTAYFQVRPGLPPCPAHCSGLEVSLCWAAGVHWVRTLSVSLTSVSTVPRHWPGPSPYTGAAGAGDSDPLLPPQFFSDVREAEEQLRKLQETLNRKYTCDRSITVTRLEDLLQDAQVSRSAGPGLCSG